MDIVELTLGSSIHSRVGIYVVAITQKVSVEIQPNSSWYLGDKIDDLCAVVLRLTSVVSFQN